VSRARRWAIGGGLAVAALAITAMLVGPGDIDATQVLSAIGRGLVGSSRADDLIDAQVWLLRAPRVLVVALVGAALAGGGAVTQGLFRNPLADPSVLGISLGAAFVAVVGIFLGLDRAGVWSRLSSPPSGPARRSACCSGSRRAPVTRRHFYWPASPSERPSAPRRRACSPSPVIATSSASRCCAG
jgi:hypothetical protein